MHVVSLIQCSATDMLLGSMRGGMEAHRHSLGYVNSNQSVGERRHCLHTLTRSSHLERSVVMSCSLPEGVPDVPGEETSIRIRAPSGTAWQPCGPVTMTTHEGLGEEAKPKNILEEIVWNKWVEVDEMRYIQPTQQLLQLCGKLAASDFKGALLKRKEETGRPGIIAEVKKASPSRGVIKEDFDPVKIAIAYEEGGTGCISVLTDRYWFQGSFYDLRDIRNAGVVPPKLCKDFVVEAYQIYKARAFGADACLLIAAVLPNSIMALLIKVAKKAGMQCIIEVHSERELARVLKIPNIEEQMIGINNRDLRTFKVSLQNTVDILASPTGQEAKRRGCFFIGESGIFTYDDVTLLQEAGVDAILVGEGVIKDDDPRVALGRLLGKEWSPEEGTNGAQGETAGAPVQGSVQA